MLQSLSSEIIAMLQRETRDNEGLIGGNSSSSTATAAAERCDAVLEPGELGKGDVELVGDHAELVSLAGQFVFDSVDFFL